MESKEVYNQSQMYIFKKFTYFEKFNFNKKNL